VRKGIFPELPPIRRRLFSILTALFSTKTMKKQKNKEPVHFIQKQTTYEKLNRWFEKNSLRWLFFVLFAAIVAGTLQFDIKPSDGGDDTTYVLEAMNIATSGKIAMGFRPPGYILFLSVFVKLFGMNLVLLKLSSFACFLGLLVAMYFAFRRRLAPVVLHVTLLLVALNPPMHKYAHATWSELACGLFLMLSMLLILKMIDRDDWKWAVAAGIVSMLGFYIRIAGVALIISALVYLLFQRRWKIAAVYGVVCIVMLSPLKILEHSTGTKSFNQASMLSLKNPFNVLEGKETIEGFVVRYADNLINHLNYQIPDVLSFSFFTPQENAAANGSLIPNGSALACIFISAIVIIGYLVPLFKQPRSTAGLIGLFIPIYVSFICISLQTVFATIRMLVPIVPFLFFGFFQGVIVLGNGFRRAAKSEIFPKAQRFVLLSAVVLLLLSLVKTEAAAEDNYPILKANIAGNEFAGFSDDWINYFNASRWIKNNLPADSTGVICRKAELFLLYAGNHNIYGIYRIEQEHPDSIVAAWRERHMTHLLYDNFQWSTTLRRYVQPVAQRYPSMFELIHQEGASERYPSYVFRLRYDVYDSYRAAALHARIK
jgi:4-amino-4-deoxy-L-arabinose transferase-like glycosyltransferase